MTAINLFPPVFYNLYKPSVFLAGTIDMGNSVDWQTEVSKQLNDLDIFILNPRRADWNSDWKQDLTDLNFVEQVNWEHSAMADATYILMYFAENSLSPITLQEFGMYSKSGKLIVACHPNFWRRGNIQVSCLRDKINLHDSIDDAVAELKSKLKNDLEL